MAGRGGARNDVVKGESKKGLFPEGNRPFSLQLQQPCPVARTRTSDGPAFRPGTREAGRDQVGGRKSIGPYLIVTAGMPAFAPKLKPCILATIS